MTVSIKLENKKVALKVDGDVYEEDAECLKGIFLQQAESGVKNMELSFCDTYYMNCKGKRCLQEMKAELKDQGVELSLQLNEDACQQ